MVDYTEFTDAGYALVHDGVIYDGTTNKTWDDLKTALGINDVNNFETALTNIINSGEVTIVTKNPKTNAFPTGVDDATFTVYETSVATNTGLQEVSDESLLKKAEAKYEADMKKIDNKDRKYDSDLAALDTERNAIKNEMETLKSVERTLIEPSNCSHNDS